MDLREIIAMPKFSPQSLSKIQTCHLDLQVIFFEIIKNFDCMVTEGHRNQIDQDSYFAQRKTQLKFPHGNHNSMPSNAIDVIPCPVDYLNTAHFNFFAGYVLGVANRLKEEGKISHSIRWGGAWNGNFQEIPEKGFQDLPHYELIP
jgi:peptidoglycan L-alanyl-D-glutamate endopeptidase CwlK